MSYGISLQLDEYDDFQFDPVSNRLVLVKGTDNCLQAIRVVLKTLKGELRFYPEFGLDLPQLMIRKISDSNVKHCLSTAILKDPRVKSVDEMIIERLDRVLNVYVQITTQDNVSLEYTESISW